MQCSTCVLVCQAGAWRFGTKGAARLWGSRIRKRLRNAPIGREPEARHFSSCPHPNPLPRTGVCLKSRQHSRQGVVDSRPVSGYGVTFPCRSTGQAFRRNDGRWVIEITGLR